MKRLFLGIIIAAVLVVVVVGVATSFYIDLLWFTQLNFEGVFWTQYLARWGIRLGAWAFAFLFLWFNLLFTRRAVIEVPNLEIREALLKSGYMRYLSPRYLSFIFLGIAAFISFVFTGYTDRHWMDLHMFLQSTDFGMVDPILNKEVSFYVFELPFLRFIYGYLMMVLVLAIILVGAIYLMANSPYHLGYSWVSYPFRGMGHVSVLAALIVLLKAWDYRLKMSELLLSPRGYTFGAGYTDVNISLNVFWVLLILSLVIGALFLGNYFMRLTRVFVYGVVTMVAVSFLGGVLLPTLVQNFLVQPSEFSYERPYIEHNIEFTRFAYGIDKFQTSQYPATGELDWSDVKENPGTFNNVRLWDYRPLETTFNSLQALRPYYRFADVDTDRYWIDGEYRQVMLSAREMDQNRFDDRAQTWINMKLQYTHGYGVVMSPVNEVSNEGLPRYFVQDIPPRGVGDEVALEQPGIYYGELTNDYVIVKTRMREFDYPRGATDDGEGANVYTIYEGAGGVEIGSLGRRLLFSLRFADYRIVLSGELTPESRVLLYRNIHDRVQKIAPFLRYDQDPYIVINDGRLFWIQDAYTLTNRFPYSDPHGNINYIRNSVKVVIDAYNGDVSMYIVDPEDPMVQTYSKIFPTLFKPLEEMPEGLRAHIRYPEHLFQVQAQVFTQYHVTDPNVFYNREDLWQIPREKYRGNEVPVEPYYVILQLPGEDREEFVLILPFTPARRENMISWMAARCDGEHYGEMMVYQFPRAITILGPMQIENRIDQNTEISEQLSLWDQAGSEVVRGNILVLPVNNSIIYVEPIFLVADGAGGLPELARVIVSFQEMVIMERSLDLALQRIFGERPGEPVPVPPDEPDPPAPRDPDEDPELAELFRRARTVFEEAQRYQRQGDWANYGRKIDELKEILESIN